MRIHEKGPAGERELLVTLEPGEKVVETLRSVAAARDLRGAWISGLGAVRDTEMGWFDVEAKRYVTRTFPGVLELLSLQGNVGRAGGEAVVHAHVLCAGRDLAAVGGHLVEAVCAVTAEIRLSETGTPLLRELDHRFDLRLIALPPEPGGRGPTGPSREG